MPQQLREDQTSRSIWPGEGLGPVAAPAVVFWAHHQDSPSVDPLGFTLTAFAVSTQLTFISPGPPRQVLYLEPDTNTRRGSAQVYP